MAVTADWVAEAAAASRDLPPDNDDAAVVDEGAVAVAVLVVLLSPFVLCEGADDVPPVPPTGGPPLRKNRAELPPPVGTSTMSKVALAPGALRLRPDELRRLSREARESKLSTEFRTRSIDEDDEWFRPCRPNDAAEELPGLSRESVGTAAMRVVLMLLVASGLFMNKRVMFWWLVLFVVAGKQKRHSAFFKVPTFCHAI